MLFTKEKLQKRVAFLENENASLKNTVVQSMNMVITYKDSMVEMRQFMNHMVQMGMMEVESNNNPEEDEEEEGFKQYALTRKKSTIH